MKILFVCLGNICRSPAAEAIMKLMLEKQGLSSQFEIDSAGCYAFHEGVLPDSRMRKRAQLRGLNLMHHCRQVTDNDFVKFDLLVAMDDENVASLKRMASDFYHTKIIKLTNFLKNSNYSEVPDPYSGNDSDFDLVLDLCEEGCLEIIQKYKNPV
jgi:protein-tyrosine phosphatase